MITFRCVGSEPSAACPAARYSNRSGLAVISLMPTSSVSHVEMRLTEQCLPL